MRRIGGSLVIGSCGFPSEEGRIGLPAMSTFQRIFPRGLYGRAALILIVPIVALQLVFSTEFIQRFYEDVTSQMTQGVAIDLAFLLDQIEASADIDEARARVVPLADGAADHPADTGRTGRPGSGPPAHDRPLRQHDHLDPARKASGSGGRRSDGREPDGGAAFRQRAGPVEAEVSRRRMSAANPHQLIVLMIFASILLTIIAYLFLRRQLRPITKLAEAAEEFGKGRMVEYRPRGAQEVRAAGRAFLTCADGSSGRSSSGR
jgi:two-component system, OmpR family, osmolarity sensor histidine kinase EnvZ